MKRILVIEDEYLLRVNTCELLESEEFEVMAAENGLAGLELAKEQHPDLVLCDIDMPLVNGYGVLKELRKDANTASIPFIFMTGMRDATSRYMALEMGANDYLTKPVGIPELLRAIAIQVNLPTEPEV